MADQNPGLKPACYEVRVRGHLARRRLRHFDYLTVTHHPDGTTSLSGPLPDQAALYGLLIWLRDLGLPLLSLNPLSAAKTDGPMGTEAPDKEL